ncbi:LSm family protein [Thermococcus aggregans]|uniref:LSm family protein n=1 Tax=Thermococcus aggregans TaxID=110163 RepID=A0A9E7SNP0_THEAG|nr:LSm family protein [Thermococcus aggregans]USS40464.1 LSm family protein [Thermococcus aggregans]
MSEEKPLLLDETLKKWKGKRIALAVSGDHSFTGILKDFDEEIIILENVADVVGNRGKALVVKIDDVNWIMLLE